jgi:phosphate transport system permease protein
VTTPDSTKIDPGLRGYQRSRTSTSFVRWSDRIAKHVITIGGIGTILVVLMVVVVLLGNVAPLFRGARVAPLATIDLQTVPTATEPTVIERAAAEPVAFGLDEYNELVWFLHPDRRITVRSVQGAVLLAEFPMESNGTDGASNAITAVSVDSKNAHVLIGYQDGSVQPVSISIEVEFRKLSDLPAETATALKQGSTVREGSVVRLTAGNLVRETRVSGVVAQDSIPLFNTAVSAVDCLVRTDESGFEESTQWVWGASDGTQMTMGVLEQKPAMLGGGMQIESQIWRNAGRTQEIADASKTIGVMVTSSADAIRSIDLLGEVRWWTPTENERLVLKQSYLSITGSESKATSMVPLLGGVSWLIGGSSGHVESVTVAATDSGQELLSIHRIPTADTSILALASAPANRMFAALSEAGTVALRYTTSESELARWSVSTDENRQRFLNESGNVPTGIELSKPKLQFNASGNTLALLDKNHLSIWNIEAAFPEASLSSFFAPVWYEGYRQPSHIWQSSTGSAEGEPKFGMWPLIFGTLKATFYSMLIAAPIALLAAIFGSEFMSNTWRLRFKPLIELMASVPSVVLGFIGAMVLAPLLRDYLCWFLLSGVLTLFFFVLAAHLWMMLPVSRAIPLRRYRLPLMFLVPPIAIGVSWLIYPSLERWLFQTSMVDWLSNRALGAWPGWFLLMLLPMVLLVVWIMTGPMRPWIEVGRGSLPAHLESRRNLLRFLLGTMVALLLAALSATILSSTGLDARGSIVGPYQERNALLVGGILGFAIIPLVYTLADDALQSVPQHLRSASLGCGATVWQTTVRVVVPTAMSGLFSALMIGFGRAIGETMVVLMAAGNTPLMELNPFNGYRTLSATLATELPEAARGSTHYHTLFLAALLLFCFTLIVNTCAEWVRIRFRKRAFQL